MNRVDGVVVPPLSKKAIAINAQAVRAFFDLETQDYFPIVGIFELLHLICDGASFEVLDEVTMGQDHGRTYPETRTIVLRGDVYERAYRGEARDRFTMCHELGHLLMHRNIALQRVDPSAPPKIYRNSEWQADMFASYLLMPKNLLASCSTLHEACNRFGVSSEAACARREELVILEN
jgi:hypothetical protein